MRLLVISVREFIVEVEEAGYLRSYFFASNVACSQLSEVSNIVDSDLKFPLFSSLIYRYDFKTTNLSVFQAQDC